ncbi:unnamed protein product [Euphydryas editha]|uniref:Uncharacterized protein n=1 Tax=Euphydryas editha TaxID=104508 RepID=A0AAU9TRU4_EUPED|nr:unnamed protein product [Euphydryas editha]
MNSACLGRKSEILKGTYRRGCAGAAWKREGRGPLRNVYWYMDSREIDGLKLGYLSFFACVRARCLGALEREGVECGREDVKNNHQKSQTGLNSLLARSRQKGKILSDEPLEAVRRRIFPMLPK